jgi:hypothetical protein
MLARQPEQPFAVPADAVAEQEPLALVRQDQPEAEFALPVRSTQSTHGFDEPAPLVLSRFPAKTKTQWEQWLLNREAVLVEFGSKGRAIACDRVSSQGSICAIDW